MKVVLWDHNSVLKGLREHFEVVSDPDKADAVLLWNDVNVTERAIIKYAKQKKIPTYAIQHGRKGSAKYYPPFNEEIIADKLLVWGDFDKRELVEAGRDASRIRVVGTTVLRDLPKRREHQGVNIVFCPEHWDRPVEENIRVRDELRKLKGVNIISKIIESHDPNDFDNPIQTDRDSDNHLQICKEVLETADLVVGISESTFELMAQAMDIPVVIMEEWTPKAFGGDLRYTKYRRVISEGAKRTTVKDLVKTIKGQLKNPDELKDERRRVAIDEGGIDLDPIAEIKKAIWTT
jgi:hypothetical protein